MDKQFQTSYVSIAIIIEIIMIYVIDRIFLFRYDVWNTVKLNNLVRTEVVIASSIQLTFSRYPSTSTGLIGTKFSHL